MSHRELREPEAAVQGGPGEPRQRLTAILVHAEAVIVGIQGEKEDSDDVEVNS